MKDPPRLLDVGDPFTRNLLRSVEADDQGYERGMAKAAMLLGLPAVTSTVGSVVGTAAAATTGATSSATTSSFAMLAKWFCVGAIVAGTGMGTVEFVSAPAVGEAHPSTAMGPAPNQPCVDDVASMAPAVVNEATSASPGIAEEPPPPMTANLGHRNGAILGPPTGSVNVEFEQPSSAPVSSALAEEVAMLDNAREALQQDDPAGALRAMDAYDKPSSTRVLEPEALRVKVEALYRLGRRAEAAQFASVFVAKYPNSPHAARMRRVATSESHLMSTP